MPVIKLRDDVLFEDPLSRILEYCEIEVYRGYDDKHTIDNKITQNDIDAANKLYAMIDRYDNSESGRLLASSSQFSKLLTQIPNNNIYDISDKEWTINRRNIKQILSDFLAIRGFGLAKTTKILHLKRPNLFPVLDSYVIKFLLGKGLDTEKTRQVDYGLEALDKTREILIQQKKKFEELLQETRDLPIPLTPTRIFDILCWTTEKWDIRKIHNAPYGIPHKSLFSSIEIQKINIDSDRIAHYIEFVVFEDLENATGPKVHAADCFYYQRWKKNKTTTTTWHGPFESEDIAWKRCQEIASRSSYEPSKHTCVK